MLVSKNIELSISRYLSQKDDMYWLNIEFILLWPTNICNDFENYNYVSLDPKINLQLLLSFIIFKCS